MQRAVLALTMDALLDLHALEKAPVYVGSQGSWWEVTCELRRLRGAATSEAAIMPKRSRPGANVTYLECDGGEYSQQRGGEKLGCHTLTPGDERCQ